MYVQSRVWLRANQTQTKVRQTDEACHSPAQPTSRTLFFNDAAEVRVPQRGDLLFLFADCCTIEINKGKKKPRNGLFLGLGSCRSSTSDALHLSVLLSSLGRWEGGHTRRHSKPMSTYHFILRT